MLPSKSFPDSGRLLARVLHAVQREDPVTFLFGSALTAPGSRPEEIGVPDGNSLVEEVLTTFRGSDEFQALESALANASPTGRYQEAMQFMIDCRGQSSLNELIRNAVLKARREPSRDHNLEHTELDTDGWHLRPAVEAVGRLIAEHPNSFSAPILTSNFDPLIEVSLRKADANPVAIFLSADGQFTNILLPGSTKVVHFHGYWRGSDTLHTPGQLTRHRPQLKGCLRSLLRETTLIVMGYGGWTDVFTRTLVDVISEQTEQLNVLWTFYSGNDEDIINRNQTLLNQFENLAGQRVVFYKGVDCHVFLPTLREKLRPLVAEENVATSTMASPSQPPRPPTIDLSASGDNPPQTPNWVGREEELRLLLSVPAKVIAITGLGGNGKSTLAAKYLELRRGAEETSVSYWADCREQSNTLATQLVRIVERVSAGRISGAQLKDSNALEVIETLFDVLGDTKALFVFDNIDQYVDLEQCSATGTMATLLDLALARKHSAQFIFTTRPKLEYSHEGFRQLQLTGLSLEETRRLFDVCGVAIDPSKKTATVAEVHSLTRGHPLALNLIATQVTKNKVSLDELISKLKRGIEAGIENPVFPEIWTCLNPKQQTVLRYLAEQIHPESEQRVASYLGTVLNYNQFSKAIKTLKALNLVVVKSPGETQPDTIELHPLVRDFVRRRFPREEQAAYIDSIIHFCNRMIEKFRGTILNVPYSVLENWTAKIELCLRRGLYGEALDALLEVDVPLHKNGYPEEFLRLAVELLESYVPSENDANLPNLDKIYSEIIDSLAYLGRYEEADFWISRFEKTMVGKTARYILLCKVVSYRYWLQGDLQPAKEWAERGVALKTSTNLDTTHDCGHNLALIQRDSGEIEPALKYFLQGEDVETLVASDKLDTTRGGPFFGNIGRCPQKQGNLAAALICIKKSAKILEQASDSVTSMNIGWAAFWIGEIQEAEQHYEIAYFAFRRAAMKWRVPSPLRARRAMDAANRVRENLAPTTTLPADDWECERAYLDWLGAN